MARLTGPELEQFDRRVARSVEKNRSDFIRAAVFSDAVEKSQAVALQLADTNFQVRKIGVNINQIAKRFNSGIYEPEEFPYILDALKQIEELLRKIMEKLA